VQNFFDRAARDGAVPVTAHAPPILLIEQQQITTNRCDALRARLMRKNVQTRTGRPSST
jgi:hypothetical protein